MNMYVLTYSNFLEEWTFTTKENYERRIQNAREIHHFSKRDGFQCTADVIHHIMKQFSLTLDQITCVNCYLTKDNNSDEQWGKCFWCNTISHNRL